MCKAQGARADSLSDRSTTRLRGGGRLDKRSRRLHKATSRAFPHRLAGTAGVLLWHVLGITYGATKDADPGVRRRGLQHREAVRRGAASVRNVRTREGT